MTDETIDQLAFSTSTLIVEMANLWKKTKAVRAAQKSYFVSRNQTSLFVAKKLEKELDEMLESLEVTDD